MWRKLLGDLAVISKTEAHHDFSDWLEDTNGEDLDFARSPKSFQVNGKRILFLTAGPLLNPSRFEDKAQELGLLEIDPPFYERLEHRLGDLVDAQEQYLYIADNLEQPHIFSYIFEARVLEAAKLRILQRRTTCEKAINDTTGSKRNVHAGSGMKQRIAFRRPET